MKRAYLAVNTTELASSTELNTYEQNHARLASLSPSGFNRSLKINFVWMKKLLFTLLFLLPGILGFAQQLDPVERAALIDLYNSTGGPNWTTPWDTTQPVETWTGITLSTDKNMFFVLNYIIEIYPEAFLQASVIFRIYILYIYKTINFPEAFLQA